VVRSFVDRRNLETPDQAFHVEKKPLMLVGLRSTEEEMLQEVCVGEGASGSKFDGEHELLFAESFRVGCCVHFLQILQSGGERVVQQRSHYHVSTYDIT
jgi:hypothetical protein